MAESERERKLELALLFVAKRVKVQADSGVPACMIAVYTRIEVMHALSDHDGPAQSCTPCYGALSGWGWGEPARQSVTHVATEMAGHQIVRELRRLQRNGIQP